jgi:phage terminase large subunit-like protein
MTLLDPDYQELKAELTDSKDEHNRYLKDTGDLPRHRMSDLYIAGQNSTMMKIAFSAKKSDGFNPSLCICDEIASWEGDQGLKQYEVMKSGMGARPEPIMFSCSTAGYVEGGIYDEIIKRCTRFLLGDSKEKRLLPFLYMIDDIEKWNDINELQKSNPNLGVSVTVDYLLEEIAIAEGSLSKKSEFIVKYCNLKQNSSLAWLPAQIVQKMCGEPLNLEDFRSSYCVAGIDLSQTTDLTAATIIIERGGEFYVFAKFWLPSEKIDEAQARDGIPYRIYEERGLLEASGENFVDYHDCYRWITSLVEDYEILPLQVGYDRYSAQYLIQDLKAYGMHTDDVFQGDNLHGVLQEMEGMFKDGKFHIGDNDLLKIHLLNAAIKVNVQRGRGRLVKINPSMHIDGTAALSDAWCVRQKWYGEIGEQLKNE